MKNLGKINADQFYFDVFSIESLQQEKVMKLVQKFLEKDLETILEEKPWLIEPGLTVIERQKPTSVGSIDLLAQDKSGTFVIIELKKERSDDKVIGQLFRYMHEVSKEYHVPVSKLRGIMFVKSASESLKASYNGSLSNSSTDNIKLIEFENYENLLHHKRIVLPIDKSKSIISISPEYLSLNQNLTGKFELHQSNSELILYIDDKEELIQKKKINRRDLLLNIIIKLADENGMVPREEVILKSKSEGLKDSVSWDLIDKLLQEGEIYEPRPGYLKIMGEY